MRSGRVDVAVIGAGPAAWAIAAATARAGLTTVLVGPAPEAVWPATYGAFADELAGAGVEVPVRVRWEHPTVVAASRHDLQRPYVLVDNAGLAAALRAAGADSGLRVWDDELAGAVADRRGWSIVTVRGRCLEAVVLVDATGHRPAVVSRRTIPGAVGAAQRGVGFIGPFDPPPAAPGSCVLMDWSVVHDEPSFLYAMDLGDGTWLVEETSLAATPPLSLRVLEARLRRRLADRGVAIGALVAEEHVHLPLDAAVPDRTQPAVGFGAAGGLVHPATGYSLAASLRAAPPVARAIAEALVGRGATPRAAAHAAWHALWPTDAVRARALLEFGLTALVGLRAGEAQAFFEAFFSLPADAWRGYWSACASAGELAGTMQALYRLVPAPVRGRLRRGDLRSLLTAGVR